MEAYIDSKKVTIAVIVISLVFTFGYIWLNGTNVPFNWETTEQHGIKFSYPGRLKFTSNTPTGWNQDYWQGSIQGEPIDEGNEVIGIYWMTDKVETTEEATNYITDMGKEENLGLSMQEIQSVIVHDHEVSLCNIDLKVEEINCKGSICSLKDEYGRIILLYHLKYPSSYGYSEKMLRRIIKSIEFEPPVYPRPLEVYCPTYGWRYATPKEMGIDGSLLQEMVEDIESTSSSVQVDSVVVVKDGYIVFEKYFNEYTKDTPHIIYSCTKSVVSTIFGIAHENGLIPGLDEHLLDLFPDKRSDNLNEWKKSITLRNLLMMSAGFDARDSWLYEWEKLNDLHEAPDAVNYILDLPMAFEPGTRFEYTNAVSHLLSCIITEKTGMSAAEYGQENLFDPLGITLHQWDEDSLGRNWGYNRIYITPHDMAKIGYLFLNEGVWNSTQIISPEWIREATKHRLDANLIDGYGYQWWVGEDYYTALGYKGQFIFVFPEQDMIIVFTGGTPETYEYSIRLPWRYILPAIK